MEHLFRQQSGKMFSVLAGLFGFDNSSLIEDIIQETFLAAMKTWRAKGAPENPEAWLLQVAKNKLINELKKRSNRARLNEVFAAEKIEDKVEELFLEEKIKDSQLRALFTCCNPVLNSKEQIMLTLKILSGFNDKEIAAALLSTPQAIKKAIYRTKKLLRANHIDFTTDLTESDIQERVEMVQTIIYLIFNEGYKQTIGENLVNENLCYEASRLAVLISEIEGEHQSKTFSLIALIYFSISRFSSRTDESGSMVDLQIQDRSKWDAELMEVGAYFLKKSRDTNTLSKYHLEATIASLHCMAASFEETDWESIAYCYKKLHKIQPNNIVQINYAIALSHFRGPEAGLIELEKIKDDIKKPLKSLFYAAKADILFRSDKTDLALSYYKVALDSTENIFDKKFISNHIEQHYK